MFRKISQLVTNTCASTAARAVLGAAVVGAIPTAALADHHDYGRRDYGRDEWRHDDHYRRAGGGGFIGIDIGGGSYCPPPAPICPPPPVCAEERVWVEPVYRTVC